ncbi:MAG: gamma-glutamyltransferase family protein [Bauldia sp.]
MHKARQSLRGMVTSPHHLASEAGLRILRAGGNAVEAAISTAAVLAVIYPHMNGIGGDSFWLVAEPGRMPVAVRAAGFSGESVDAALFAKAGLDAVPVRGPLAATTVAGTIAGWSAMLDLAGSWGKPLGLEPLLEEAIHHAEAGYPVTAFQAEVSGTHLHLLADLPGFADAFLADRGPTPQGTILKQPALGRTLRSLAGDGLDGFYRGRLAAAIAADLERQGSPLTAADLAAYRATRTEALTHQLRNGIRLHNHPPPSQGLASLIILALFERLGVGEDEGFSHIHGLIEATKKAFAVRDAVITDPARMTAHPAAYLDAAWLDREASSIDPCHAASWEAKPAGGDTVWFGVVDAAGRAVSAIQSVYLKFGSGIVLPETGILWQNRGAAFELDPLSPRFVGPRRQPFHTLNPAMADFPDGRRMVYGSMGGDGQPQFQAALFTRYAFFGRELQDAVSAPRWLLARRFAADATEVHIEDRFPSAVIDALRAAGHQVALAPPVTSQMGHAGAIVRHHSGLLDGAADPRSDGAAAGF